MNEMKEAGRMGELLGKKRAREAWELGAAGHTGWAVGVGWAELGRSGSRMRAVKARWTLEAGV